MSTGLKTWKENPSESEIKNAIGQFFTYLQKGELDNAKNYVTHAYEDWLDTIFVIWEDHYLIHATPKDSSFDGKVWLNDLTWLKNLDIIKDDFNIYLPNEKRKNTFVDIGLQYRGEPSGYAAKFSIIKDEKGEYYMQREFIGMA
jgi:hypothetical protein